MLHKTQDRLNIQGLDLENEKNLFETERLNKRTNDLEQHLDSELNGPDDSDIFRDCYACKAKIAKDMTISPLVRELQDKVERYRISVLKTKNQNLLLNRDLKMAKKVICQELGVKHGDIDDILRQSARSTWKGRQEEISLLKTKNLELRDKLEDRNLQSPTKRSPSEIDARKHFSEDRKNYWRMELEKRKAYEALEREKDEVADELLNVRKKLQVSKNRNLELMSEMNMLRAELFALSEKSRNDDGILISLKNAEIDLKAAMNDRSEYRRLWDGSKHRNKMLTDQILVLKEQIEIFKTKSEDDSNIIETLTAQQLRTQTLLEREQMLNHQQTQHYRDDLRKMHHNHASNMEILQQIQTSIDEKDTVIQILRTQLEIAARVPAEKSSEENKEVGSNESLAGGGEEDEEDTEEKLEIKEKEKQIEMAKYKTLYEASTQECEKLSEIISDLYKRIDTFTIEIFEIQQLNLQKEAERIELLAKIKILQHELKEEKKKKAGPTKTKKTTHKQKLPSEKSEELHMKLDVISEENDFLRNFLATVIKTREENFQIYKTIANRTQQQFKVSLDTIKEELAKKPVDEEEDEENEED